MSTPIFCRLSPAVTVDILGAASSETGLSIGEAVADDANVGGMQLRGSGDPDAATSLDIVATRGGYARGAYLSAVGTPGMQFRWMTTGGSTWMGYNEAGYLRDIRTSYLGGALTDTLQVSEIRQLASGNMGFVGIGTYNGSDILRWFRRALPTDNWSTVNISTAVLTDWRPGWVQLDDGRIIAYAVEAGSGRPQVTAWTSTDDGATWAIWSQDTQIGVSGAGTICAEVVRDAVLIALGPNETDTTADVTLHWSADGGQGFSTTTASDDGTFRVIRLLVTSDGLAYLVAGVDDGGVSSFAIRAYPIAYGGGISDYVDTRANIAEPGGSLAVARHDDGTLWVWGGAAAPMTFLEATVSLDGGLTWNDAGGGAGATVFTNGAVTTTGFNTIAAGSFKGSLVVIGSTASTSTAVNSVVELWFGGYDSLTEYASPGTNGQRFFAGFYGYGGVQAMTDIPDTSVYTRSDTGAGSTTSITADGLKMVGTGANNSQFTSTTAAFNVDSGDSYRMRFKVKVDSGGSILSNEAIIRVSVDDGANRQFWRLRFADTGFRLTGASGTLATVAHAMTSPVEFFVAFAHDYPAAGDGLLSVWYKDETATAWTAVVTNQAVGEDAGTATNQIEFGGTAVGTPPTWYLQGPWWAPGSAEMDEGFTSPDDLHGRSLSADVDVYVSSGIRLGARGDAAVPGDAWTLPTAYALGASNLFRSLAPSCRAQTEPTNAAQTYVIGDGSMPIALSMVALIGTNYRQAYVEFSNTNSWASVPSVLLDATVYEGAIVSSATGCLTFAPASFTPHRFRTTEGRRWFLAVGSDAYEILDNDDRRLYVSGLASGLSGTARVFADRMAAEVDAAAWTYLRIRIPGQATADGDYRTGTPWFGLAQPTKVVYDSGFVDRWSTPTTAYATSRGYRRIARSGVETHELRVSWGIVDRLTFSYLQDLVYALRGLDGESQPVLFWRDPTDATAFGLYTVDGPPTIENAYGEGRDALERLSQLRLREFL